MKNVASSAAQNCQDLNQHLPASLTPAVVPGSAEACAATTLREGEREEHQRGMTVAGRMVC